MLEITERVLLLVVGGAVLLCTIHLLTGGDLVDLLMPAIAFAVGGALPSPLKRGG